jgi:hypothetical protein
MHAWRRLGQLATVEAAEPLTRIFEILDPVTAHELPAVYSMIGPAALPALKAFLSDSLHFPFARGIAVACIERIAQDYSHLIHDACETILVQQLESYEENPAPLNSMLIRYLLRMETSAADLIRVVYDSGRVLDTIAGKWEDVSKQLGLEAVEGEGQEAFAFARFSAARKPADKKKKAKRKQAQKMRKLSRKKKR